MLEDKTEPVFEKGYPSYDAVNRESYHDYMGRRMREEAKKNGGMIDKPLGSGGVKSGPPPKSGPDSQGLKVPLKQVKQ
mgnify:CR=1 FL=1